MKQMEDLYAAVEFLLKKETGDKEQNPREEEKPPQKPEESDEQQKTETDASEKVPSSEERIGNQ